MRKFLLPVAVLMGVFGAGLTTQASAANSIVRIPALISSTDVRPIEYDGWREREWRRHERWEEWRRHEEWRRWHHYHGY